MGQVSFIVTPPISFGVKLDKPKFRIYSLSQSKVMAEKPLGVSLVSEGLKDLINGRENSSIPQKRR